MGTEMDTSLENLKLSHLESPTGHWKSGASETLYHNGTLNTHNAKPGDVPPGCMIHASRLYTGMIHASRQFRREFPIQVSFVTSDTLWYCREVSTSSAPPWAKCWVEQREATPWDPRSLSLSCNNTPDPTSSPTPCPLLWWLEQSSIAISSNIHDITINVFGSHQRDATLLCVPVGNVRQTTNLWQCLMAVVTS